MKTLGDVIKIETGEQLNKSDMLPDAEHPVVNGGIDFSGYTDKYNSEANTITISQGGASAGYVNWLDQKFWAGAHCYVVTSLPNNDVRFLYHFIKSREYNFMNNQQGAGIPSLNRSEVYKTAFPDYDYCKQKEIAEILDSFTSMITNLETELASRQKQYEYYRDQLFGEDVDVLINRTDCKIKTISELGSLTRGKRFVRTDIVEEGVPCIHYGDMYTFYGLKAKSAKTHITKEKAKSMRFARNGDVVIVGAGENDWDIGVGLVWLGDENAAIHDACYILEHEQNPMYISHYLRSTVYHLQLRKYVSSGKISSFSSKDLGKILIPIPTKERQREIVSTLDTFESLITNIKQELEARKKQYEYYREQLLTFE